MKKIKVNKLTSCLRVALLSSAAMSAQQSLAQDSQAQDSEIEVIQVKGIRASQVAAINQKRYANAVVDSISSEDIGKFPDTNIAESLQRVPGISITRSFTGEGGAVSIRGSNPELTLMTMNGNYLASTGWWVRSNTRSFDMDLLPPEMIASVDVFKSSMASLDEGGVGGTVNVKTRKPLDLDANTVFVSAQVQSNTIADGYGKGATGMYSWKNEDNSFGVLAAVSSVETVGRAHKAENYMDGGWGGAGIAEFYQNRERTAIDLTLQYAPSDNLDMSLHYFDVGLDPENTNQNYLLIAGTGPNTATFNSQVTGATAFGPDSGRALNGTWAGAALDDTNYRGPDDLGTYVTTYEINYQGDDFTVSSQIGYTKAKGGDGGNYKAQWQSINANQSIDFDFTGDKAILLSPNNTDPSNHAEYAMLPSSSIQARFREDKELFGQIDLTHNVDWGSISSLQAGVKLRKHELSTSRIDYSLSDGYADGVTKADFADGTFGHSGAGLAGDSPTNIARVNGAAVADYLRGFINGSTDVKPEYGVVKEDIFASYIQANFSGDDFRGNLGLRYVATDNEGQYYDFFDSDQLQTEKGSYADWLPSFNLAFNLTDSIILRGSAAKVISRPNYSFLNPAYSINSSNYTISRGSVRLDPYKATQADLGVEWYFNESSLVSLTFFNKDITSFIQANSRQSELTVDGESWTVLEPGQGLGGQVQGAEFQYQQQIGNWGWSGNLTYADGYGLIEKDGNIVKQEQNGLSKFTYSLSAFYENEHFAARLSYTKRDDYLAISTGVGGTTRWDANGSLVGSLTWHATENIDVSLEGNNLMDETTYQRLNTEYDALRVATDNGRNLYLKVSYRL